MTASSPLRLPVYPPRSPCAAGCGPHPRRITRMTRYRGGTYSHTVDTIVFTDGTSARAPTSSGSTQRRGLLARLRRRRARPGRRTIGSATWSAVPNLRAQGHTRPRSTGSCAIPFRPSSTAELSRRLRAAGYRLGRRNIAEHEAIAATQAAIWYFTNDMQLDNRPRNVPVAVRSGADSIDLRVRR